MDKYEPHREKFKKVVEAGVSGAKRSLEGQSETLRRMEEHSRTFLGKSIDKR